MIRKGVLFVLLTCLLGQIENHNTMIIAPKWRGNITDVWNSKVWACPESVIDASENKKEQVLRIHCVAHISRGMYNDPYPPVTGRSESHDQTTVTKGNAADFVGATHRMETCMKKIIFKEVFDTGNILCVALRSKILPYCKPPFMKNILFVLSNFPSDTLQLLYIQVRENFIPLGFHRRRFAEIFNEN